MVASVNTHTHTLSFINESSSFSLSLLLLLFLLPLLFFSPFSSFLTPFSSSSPSSSSSSFPSILLLFSFLPCGLVKPCAIEQLKASFSLFLFILRQPATAIAVFKTKVASYAIPSMTDLLRMVNRHEVNPRTCSLSLQNTTI